MEYNLCIKEEELVKENIQLEKETKELLQRSEEMKIHDNILEIFTELELEDIPASVDDMSKKAMSHFYKAKIKTMQTDYEKLQTELKKKTEDVRRLEKDNQNLNEEKDKWFLHFTATKNTTGKFEKQIQILNNKLQEKETEKSCLKKEIKQLKNDLKATNNHLSTSDLKLNRTFGEMEILKTNLKNYKQEQKELREIHQKQLNELNVNLKQIEKQKMELLAGYKKQMQLIDILKKQKANLKSLTLAEIAENAFTDIVNWRFD